MKSALLATAAFFVAGATAAGAYVQSASGPGGTAEYWMSAETTSGMAAMSGMQGGRPNIGAILSGRGAGQGPTYVHNLTLQLGSPRRAAEL